MFKIMIAGDDFTRRGIENLISLEPRWSVCPERIHTNYDVVSKAGSEPNLVILGMSSNGHDFGSHDIDGVTASCFLRGQALFLGKKLPPTKTLLYTVHYTTELVRHIQWAGFSAYVLKSEPEERLLEAIRAVEKGRIAFPAVAASALTSNAFSERLDGLSATNRWVLCMRSCGCSFKEIADWMNTKSCTVKSQVAQIRRSLGGKLREQIRYAIRNRMIDGEVCLLNEMIKSGVIVFSPLVPSAESAERSEYVSVSEAKDAFDICIERLESNVEDLEGKAQHYKELEAACRKNAERHKKTLRHLIREREHMVLAADAQRSEVRLAELPPKVRREIVTW
jgi:DNA-binding NarL/FixJ family response regulator